MPTVIDAHAHFRLHGPAPIPPARLATCAGVSGFECMIVSNRDGAARGAGAADVDETTTNLASLDALEAHPRLRPLYWVRPGAFDGNIFAFIGAMQQDAFVGAIFAPSENGFAADDPALDPYFKTLTEVSKPAVFLATAEEHATALRVYLAARRHPRLSVLICHADQTPMCQVNTLDAVRNARVRRDAQLFMSTSYMSAPAIRSAVEQVGSDSVVFGTNAPALGDAHAPRYIALLEELRRLLSPADYARVVCENAAKLFKL